MRQNVSKSPARKSSGTREVPGAEWDPGVWGGGVITAVPCDENLSLISVRMHAERDMQLSPWTAGADKVQDVTCFNCVSLHATPATNATAATAQEGGGCSIWFHQGESVASFEVKDKVLQAREDREQEMEEEMEVVPVTSDLCTSGLLVAGVGG